MSLDPHHRHHRAVDLCDELNADINLAFDMQPFLKLETVKALIPHEYADAVGGAKSKYVESLEAQATELESDIEDLKSKVDILRGTVDRHQEREDELESENTDFKNQVADLEQNVGALSRHIERLEDRIRDLTS